MEGPISIAMDHTSITELRAYHLANYVLQQELTNLPDVLWWGEAEYFLLEPLHQLAQSIWSMKDGEEPASITAVADGLARKYGNLAGHMSVMGNKLAMEAFGAEVIKKSALWDIGDAGPAEVKREDISRKISSLLSSAKLPEIFEGSSPPPGNVGSYGPKTGAVAIEVMDTWFEDMLRFAGTGRGMPIYRSQYGTILSRIMKVAWAAQALIDPSKRVGRLAMKSTLYPNQSIALSLALLSYLYYLKDLSQYDAKFPPYARAATSQMMVTSVQAQCYRLATYWATISVSPSIEDFLSAIDQTERLAEWCSPMIMTPSPDYKHALEVLSSCRDRLRTAAFAPLSAHTERVKKILLEMSQAEVILPRRVIEFFSEDQLDGEHQLRMTEQELIIPVGSSLPQLEHILSPVITQQQAEQLMALIRNMATNLRYASDLVSLQMKSFFADIVDLDPGTIGLPSDLLSDGGITIPKLSELNFDSVVEVEMIPISCPRFAPIPDPSRDNLKPSSTLDLSWRESGIRKRRRQWVLKPLTYSVVSLSALRKIVRDSQPSQFKWRRSRVVSLPITLPERFANSPVPLLYSGSNHFPSIANSIDDVFALLRGQGQGWVGNDPSVDIAQSLLLSPRDRDAIANAYAGLFRIYISDAAGSTVGSRNADLITPSLPVIYGVPTSQFLEQQQTPSSIDSELMDQWVKTVVVKNPTLGVMTGVTKVVTFVLHDKYPLPDQPLLLPWEFEFTRFQMVPVSAAAILAAYKDAVENSNKKWSFEEWTTVDDGVRFPRNYWKKKFVSNPGFSTFLAPMPHISYTYQPTISELGLSTDVLNSMSHHIQRVSDAGTGFMRLMVNRVDAPWLIEESDYLAAISGEVESLTPVIDGPTKVTSSATSPSAPPTPKIEEIGSSSTPSGPVISNDPSGLSDATSGGKADFQTPTEQVAGKPGSDNSPVPGPSPSDPLDPPLSGAPAADSSDESSSGDVVGEVDESDKKKKKKKGTDSKSDSSDGDATASDSV